MIVNRLGQGGMASLYLARDPAIDRLVAIKVLREGFDSEDLRERFAREARSAGRLHHLNIVTIFDVGEHEGEPFIAMEYVAGDTLAQIIRRRAPIGLGRKLEWLEGLCSGLGYAHQAGIVHRDIKPANIMVDGEGVLKILDFGIARVGDSSMTQAGMLVGTLNYMSPEQIAGEPVGHRSDIFAVGAVAYELLSYKQAFPGNLQTGILHRILYEDPERLSGIVADLGADLVAIVDRALAKKPADRYPDLGAMRKDLARVRRTLPPDAVVDDQDGATIAVAPPEPVTPRTTRRGPDLEDLARRRTLQIEVYVTAGREAEAAGDLEKAMSAAEQALMLDPHHGAARDLMERVRAAQDRVHAEESAKEASNALARGAIDDATEALERAIGFGLDPASPEATRLGDRIAELRQARQREQAARDLVGRARARLEAGSPESAIRLAAEAAALGVHAAEALEIRQQAEERIAARRREEEATRAGDAVRAARDRFSAGARVEAIADLVAFTPPHAIVGQAIAELRAIVQEDERRRREAEAEARRREEEARRREAEARRREEEARRQAERERQARDARRRDLVSAAKAAAAAGRFEESLRALDEAAAVSDDPSEVAAVRGEVETARAAAEAERARAAREARRVQLLAAARTAAASGHFADSLDALDQAAGVSDDRGEVAALRAEVEAARAAAEAARARAAREARRAELLAAARTAAAAERFDDSVRALDDAAALSGSGDASEVTALRAEVEAARAAAEAARERQRQVSERLADGQRALQAGDLARARGAAAAALKIDASHTGARKFEATVDQAEKDAQEAARREADRERQRQAAARLAEGRQALTAGDFGRARDAAAAALALDAGSDGARKLEADVRRGQEEAEAAARREAERERQRQVAARLAEGRQALKAGDFGRARDQAAAALALDAGSDGARRLEADVQRGQEEAEAAARREAERERDRQAAARVAEGQKALDGSGFARARELAAAALELSPSHAAARRLQADIERAEREHAAAAERARRLDELVAEADRRVTAGDLPSARAAIRQALALDPRHEAARRLDSAIASAEAETEQAAARQRQVEAALGKARKASSPKRAASLAEQALALDPENADARHLLEQARASMTAAAAAGEMPLAHAAADVRRVAETGAAARAGTGARLASRPVLAGLAAVLLLVAVVGAWMLWPRDRTPATQGKPGAGAPSAHVGEQTPPGGSAMPAPPGTRAQPPASAPATPASPAPSPDQPSATSGSRDAAGSGLTETQLAELRRAARDKVRSGDREGALASAMAVLGSDPQDTVMKTLVRQLLTDAQAAAAKARDAAAGAGARESARPLFEKAQQAERQAAKTKDREPEAAVRTYWQAAILYTDASASARQAAVRAETNRAAEGGRPAPPSQPVSPPSSSGRSEPPESSRPNETRPTPLPAVPPPVPPPSGSAPVAPPRPASPESAPPTSPATTAAPASAGSNAPRGTAPDPIVRDETAIRAALDAYRAAYQNLDVDALQRVQPSLTSAQVSSIKRAFADSRSYSVDISGESIKISGSQATVSCTVTRRFSSKSGVANGNTLATVFHLQRNGSAWTISSIESR